MTRTSPTAELPATDPATDLIEQKATPKLTWKGPYNGEYGWELWHADIANAKFLCVQISRRRVGVGHWHVQFGWSYFVPIPSVPLTDIIAAELAAEAMLPDKLAPILAKLGIAVSRDFAFRHWEGAALSDASLDEESTDGPFFQACLGVAEELTGLLLVGARHADEGEAKAAAKERLVRSGRWPGGSDANNP